MVRSRLFFLISGLMLVLSCASAKPEIDLAAEKETIRKLIPDLLKAELRRDMRATLSYLAPDAVIQLAGVPGQVKDLPTALTGTTEIRAVYEEIFKMPYTDLVWKPQTLVLAASGDLAYEIGSMKVVFEGPDAMTVVPGKATTIWRKVDSQWKAAIMLISMDEPY